MVSLFPRSAQAFARQERWQLSAYLDHLGRTGSSGSARILQFSLFGRRVSTLHHMSERTAGQDVSDTLQPDMQVGGLCFCWCICRCLYRRISSGHVGKLLIWPSECSQGRGHDRADSGLQAMAVWIGSTCRCCQHQTVTSGALCDTCTRL